MYFVSNSIQAKFYYSKDHNWTKWFLGFQCFSIVADFDIEHFRVPHRSFQVLRFFSCKNEGANTGWSSRFLAACTCLSFLFPCRLGKWSRLFCRFRKSFLFWLLALQQEYINLVGSVGFKCFISVLLCKSLTYSAVLDFFLKSVLNFLQVGFLAISLLPFGKKWVTFRVKHTCSSYFAEW